MSRRCSPPKPSDATKTLRVRTPVDAPVARPRRQACGSPSSRCSGCSPGIRQMDPAPLRARQGRSLGASGAAGSGRWWPGSGGPSQLHLELDLVTVDLHLDLTADAVEAVECAPAAADPGGGEGDTGRSHRRPCGPSSGSAAGLGRVLRAGSGRRRSPRKGGDQEPISGVDSAQERRSRQHEDEESRSMTLSEHDEGQQRDGSDHTARDLGSPAVDGAVRRAWAGR
jgi:hypothetical protein